MGTDASESLSRIQNGLLCALKSLSGVWNELLCVSESPSRVQNGLLCAPKSLSGVSDDKNQFLGLVNRA